MPVNENIYKDIDDNLSMFTDYESEFELNMNRVDKVTQTFLFGGILNLKSNVYQVNSAAIIKAPVMAVNTDSGFSIEVIADTGAEV